MALGRRDQLAVNPLRRQPQVQLDMLGRQLLGDGAQRVLAGERLGNALSEIGTGRRLWLMAKAYARHWAGGFKPPPKLLTETYLDQLSVK